MTPPSRTFGICAAALAVAAPSALGAMKLDPTFGTKGTVFDRTQFQGLGEDGTALDRLVPLSDGKILVLGARHTGGECNWTSNLTVVRHFANGARDAAYGVVPSYGTAPEAIVSGCTAPNAVAHAGGTVTYLGNPSRTATDRLGLRTLAATGRTDRATPMSSLNHALLAATPSGGALVLDLAARSGRVHGPDLVAGGSFAVPTAIRSVAATTPGQGRIAEPAGKDAVLVAVGRKESVIWRISAADGATRFVAKPPTRLPVSKGQKSSYVTFGLLHQGPGPRTLLSVQFMVRPVGAKPSEGHLETFVVALNARGQLVRSWGEGGFAGPFPSNVAAAPDTRGGVVVASTFPRVSRGTEKPGAVKFVVERLDSRGRRDAGFSRVTVPTPGAYAVGYDLALDAQGRVLLGAAVARKYGDSGLFMARLR